MDPLQLKEIFSNYVAVRHALREKNAKKRRME
jgi:hypothetical protein